MAKKVPIYTPPGIEDAIAKIEAAAEARENEDYIPAVDETVDIQFESYSPEKLLDKRSSFKPNKVPSNSGILHTHTPAPNIIFKKAEETVFPDVTSPAQIVFGMDRPDSRRSGYGRMGSNRAATIDLVVGRMASARKGKGVKDGSRVDNSFSADAARIYISQLTDVDKNFGIDRGASGIMKQRSAIGIKADGVRIIGREGIKIVTGKGRGWKGFGKKGELNSLGGKITYPAPPIELIAGNASEPQRVLGGLFSPGESELRMLQGVAKGGNTTEALRDLGTIVDEIWSAVFNFMIYQMVYNAALGPALSPLPAAPIVAGACSAATTAHVNFCINPLYHTRANKTMWEANHLERTGQFFVESRNVFST
tara:strand:- start:1907 stop:3004 length:1098 start_codon:yes stop_codon:yes gene_type:complete